MQAGPPRPGSLPMDQHKEAEHEEDGVLRGKHRRTVRRTVSRRSQQQGQFQAEGNTHLEFGIVVHENGDDPDVGNEPGEEENAVKYNSSTSSGQALSESIKSKIQDQAELQHEQNYTIQRKDHVVRIPGFRRH